MPGRDEGWRTRETDDPLDPDSLRKLLTELRTLSGNVQTLTAQVASIDMAIQGNRTLRLRGLLDGQESQDAEIAKLRAEIDSLVAYRKEIKDQLRGLVIGVTLASVTGAGTLAAMIAQFFGVIGK